MKPTGIAVLGAIIGGCLGYFLFAWILKQGLYAMILPGALLGFGARFGKSPAIAIPIACGVAALLLGFFCEWKHFPFRADASLGYFIKHLHQLKPITLLMIIAGGLLGFWIPFRQARI